MLLDFGPKPYQPQIGTQVPVRKFCGIREMRAGRDRDQDLLG
jgi:hypothetical protein